MSSVIKPTVGRVVHYFPAKSKYEFGFSIFGGHPHAAIVTAVHSDTCVNLAVFDSNGKTFPATSVPLFQQQQPKEIGDHAAWMPYQREQAAKQEAEARNDMHAEAMASI